MMKERWMKTLTRIGSAKEGLKGRPLPVWLELAFVPGSGLSWERMHGAKLQFGRGIFGFDEEGE